MNHKLLTICALAALTAGLTGCNESVDNGMDCSDGAYHAQCVDSKYMMYCDTATKTEKVKACDGGFVCSDKNGVADCIDPNAASSDPQPGACTNGAVQCSGSYVQTCQNDAWVSASAPCQYGCENGVCKAAPSVDCTNEGAKQCNSDNSNVQTCTNGSWVDDAPACEYGCENGACKSAPDDGCSEEGAVQCNSDNSNVQTCTDGKWVDDFPACNFGCENGACKEPPKECEEEGAKQCNSDNTNVQICTEGSWVDGSPACDYGCENGDCKPAPIENPCDEEGALQCAEDTVQTCTDGRWTNADSACPYGCDNGKCKPEPVCGDGEINGDEECDGELLNDKTCGDIMPLYTGSVSCDPNTCKFVTDECVAPADGSECNPQTFVESCNGTKVVMCYNGEVVNGDRLDCADYKAVCAVVTVSGAPYADCFTDDDKCDAPGDPYRACFIYESDSGNIPYSGLEQCRAASDGNNYLVNVTTSEEEIHACGLDAYVDAPACLEETGDCGILSEKDGKACDSDTDKFECDGTNVILYCNNDVWKAYTCADGILEGTQCIDMGAANGGAYCYLPCTMPADPDSEISICSNDSYYGPQSYIGVCTAAPDKSGNYLIQTEYEVDCAHGCDDASGECTKLVDDEGDVCDETYAPVCKTNIAVNCSLSYWGDGSVEAEDCANDTCTVITAEIEGDTVKQAMCMDTASECTNVGEETLECYQDYLTQNLCASGDNGKNYKVMIDYERCAHGCDATKNECIKLVAEEGDKCDYYEYEPYCLEGEVTVNCDDWYEEITAAQCTTGTTCHVTENGAECLSSCNNPGTTTSVCETESFLGVMFYTTYHTSCVSMDGGNFEVVTEEYCSNSCNEDNTGCLKLSDKEGTECEYGTDLLTCDGDGVILQCSSSNTWSAYACEEAVGAGTKCADMGSSKGAYCYRPCTNVGDTALLCDVEEDYYGTYYYSVDYVCTANADGTANYLMEADYEYCSSGACDETTGMCAAKTYDPCDSSCTVTGGKSCIQYCIDKYGEGTACTLDGSYIKCGATCKEGDEDTVQCEYYIGTEYEGDIDAYVAHCTELSDGTYMWIRESSYTECAPGTCTEGVGCDE